MINVFSSVFALLITFFNYLLFKPIFDSNMNLYSSIKIFNLFLQNPGLFFKIKISFLLLTFFVSFIIMKKIISHINPIIKPETSNQDFSLLVGYSLSGDKVYIPEKSLYQNMLIIGSIGCGKTSSAMYPFTKQLLSMHQKPGFLILDVKGNYFSQVIEFSKDCSRLNDLIIIELNGKYKYNPLDKPFLSSSIIANRLKSILLLFSPNNSESYWLDVAEQVIESSITIIRAYNNNFVNFIELHKIIINQDYFSSKLKEIREFFISNSFSKSEIYNITNAISYMKNNYYSLDSRTFNILKSDITRITNPFISNYEVRQTFCPSREDENFYGFDEVIKDGRIVVLNMNIAKYRNVSKIIAAYLKLDFQTDVLKQLSDKKDVSRPMCFISDEYQEYVTSNDAEFYAQSREAKCINIVATQSYTSLLKTLNNESAVKVIIQNLINKIWLRTDDSFTIEEAQKQIGKEDKEKFSKSVSENAKETVYNYFTNSLNSKNSSITESINSVIQHDYIFDTNYFTQDLDTFNCIAFLSTGTSIIPPKKIKLIPYFIK